MMRRNFFQTAAGAVGLIWAISSLAASTSLPGFTLTTSDGKSVASVQAAFTGNWVLVYVQPPSGYGDIVLSELNDGMLGPLTAKAVVVIGGLQTADAQKYIARFPHLKGVAWYSDPTRQTASALHLAGTPAAFGMRDQTIQWQFVGTTPDNTYLRSILKSWREKAN